MSYCLSNFSYYIHVPIVHCNTLKIFLFIIHLSVYKICMNIHGLIFVKVKNKKKEVRIVSELTVLKICKHFYCGKIMNGLKSALTWDITLLGFKY